MFGAKELAAQTAVQVGRTTGHLAVSAGLWTVWLAIDEQGRFPDVGGAVPRTRLATTLELDESDAGSLLEALHRLRASDDRDTEVTVELAPTPVVRTSAGPDSPPSKVTLVRSAVTGPSVAVGVSWRHLARAIGLGLRRFRFAGPDRPWVASDEDRTYLSASLPVGATSGPTTDGDAADQMPPEPDERPIPEPEEPMTGLKAVCRVVWAARKPVLVAVVAGLVVTSLALLSPTWVGTVLSGIGGAATAAAVQGWLWVRRAVRPLLAA